MTWKGITKRQMAAYARKRAILSSHAFQTWWQWRQHIHPHPSDPYRAYMIDIGLYARVHHKEIWQRRVNRMDMPDIDLPLHAPAIKRRMPSRKTMARYKPVPMAAQPYGGLPAAPWMEEYQKELEKGLEAYHLPKADIIFERRSGAAYRPALFGTPKILMPYEYAKSLREQPRSSFRHEFGHHVHSAFGGSGRISTQAPPEIGALISGAPFSGVRGYGVGKDVLAEEKITHDIAKHFSKSVLKKPYTKTQSWRARWAYGTYLGSVKGKGIAEVIMSR